MALDDKVIQSLNELSTEDLKRELLESLSQVIAYEKLIGKDEDNQILYGNIKHYFQNRYSACSGFLQLRGETKEVLELTRKIIKDYSSSQHRAVIQYKD